MQPSSEPPSKHYSRTLLCCIDCSALVRQVDSWNYDMLDVAIDLIEEMDTLFIEALKESELVGSILNKMNQR